MTDVLVVGAGPVGLTAALWLADGGASVVVVETATRPGDLPRAISIADETFRIMERLGIADDLKAESLLDTGSRYFGLNDRLLASSKPVPSRIGHPAKSQFDQPVLEALLWERAVRHDRIELLTGVTAVAIEQDDESVAVTVRTEGGAARTRVLRASWLVGADGGRSFTRDALGVRLVGSTQQERWIVIDLVNVPEVRAPYAEFHGNGRRPYVLVPGIKGRLRVEYMLFDDEDPDAMTTTEAIVDLARPLHPGIVPEDIRRAVVYVAHQRIAEHYRAGRAFLVGDAAHLMPPFSGQGLNAGLRDAVNIAWKLLEVIRGGGTERLLDSYETERRAHGAKMVTISRRTGAVVMATGRVRPRLRDAAFRTVSVIPAIHRYLSSMRFITPPDYSRGVAVRPRGVDHRLAAWVGRAVSQPLVSDAAGNRSGLDARLGSGWAVLAIGPARGDAVAALDGYWTRLGAKLLRLVDDPAAAPTGAELVDRTGSLTGVAELAETHYVVVRPDKYVAAVFTAAGEHRVVAALQRFDAPRVSMRRAE
ncbi:FAD-dependent monooxygenase [Lysinimonas soli]|uniref:FAD-dependent monooxygenase n=1 Tax=Lysinimonas soli TaxID=1074233 RepID=A0ABW0NTC8_9MICO